MREEVGYKDAPHLKLYLNKQKCTVNLLGALILQEKCTFIMCKHNLLINIKNNFVGKFVEWPLCWPTWESHLHTLSLSLKSIVCFYEFAEHINICTYAYEASMI